MNRDVDSLNRYLRIIVACEARDSVLFAVTVEQDGIILAGDHSSDGWCWCQPVVFDLPCHGGQHVSHPQINHRRAHDMIILDDDNAAGWTVGKHGQTWPDGQRCVGPADKPVA